jgi:hypothetical protein
MRADVLRCGETQRVLGQRVMAPSTLGTFLRAFTFGQLRQLDRAFETILGRAWAAGAGPGAEPLTIDLDSTIVEVSGHAKQGAGFGYTKRRGYHPIVASRADSGEVLHARMRKGSAQSQRGAERFVRELVRRLRRLGATGPLLVRADSGFWSNKTIAALEQHGVRYSIGVTQQESVRRAIERIPEQAWQPLDDYPPDGIAEIAEGSLSGRRLVVRRTRLVGAQAQLFPDRRYHAFITDRDEQLALVEADHRRHAQIELAIRDLKEGSGLNHAPSGRFFANGAWLLISALAHNLVRWIAHLGLAVRGPIVAQTIRRRSLTLPGRITRSARRRTLRLPAGPGATVSPTRSRDCERYRCWPERAKPSHHPERPSARTRPPRRASEQPTKPPANARSTRRPANAAPQATPTPPATTQKGAPNETPPRKRWIEAEAPAP